MSAPLTEDQFSAANSSVPEGWFLALTRRFNTQSEAKIFIKSPTTPLPEPACAVAAAFNPFNQQFEIKAIKRGGSSDPHYLLVARPLEV